MRALVAGDTAILGHTFYHETTLLPAPSFTSKSTTCGFENSPGHIH